MVRIAVVQSMIPDYRVPFYLQLHSELAVRSYQLEVFASEPPAARGFADGLKMLPFGTSVPRYDVAKNAYWHPLWSRLKGFDLVVVQQENGALLNYALFATRAAARKPRAVAFWGHGTTFQKTSEMGIRKMIKRRMSRLPDHWFAYTERTTNLLIAQGYPADRITTVNNSVDLSEISTAVEQRRDMGRASLRERLGIGSGPTAVFCSRLYAGKNVEFLLASVERVKVRIPDFQLLIIGDGPIRADLDDMVRDKPWINLMGARYGSEKADLLAAADVMLLPSYLGLSILDGFAAELPVIVADFGNHGPEIAYLVPSANGLLVGPPAPDVYAAEIIRLVADKERLATMSLCAATTAQRYSLSAMVDNFVRGIVAALG